MSKYEKYSSVRLTLQDVLDVLEDRKDRSSQIVLGYSGKESTESLLVDVGNAQGLKAAIHYLQTAFGGPKGVPE